MTDTKAQRAALTRNPNFRWLMRGSVVSLLGDQLTLIALPWLVLKLTGDPLALGLVVAMMSVPRAIFILIGGALVDRHSPKRVLMLSKYANAVLLALLTALVLTPQTPHTIALSDTLSFTLLVGPQMTLSVLYALALAIGLAQAFSIPAGTSILPRAIAPEHLDMANGIMMGLRQISMLAGPLLAAALIALGGDGGTGSNGTNSNGMIANAHGIALAFGIDCLSFLLSAWTLSQVRMPPAAPAANQPAVLRAVGAGLLMVWRDHALRTCFTYWGVVALFIGGSLQVALPVLADQELHGASAFGLLMGANGSGMLIGMAIAAVGGARLRLASFGATILLVDALAGALLIPLGAIQATWQGALLLLLIGVLSGFMQIAVFSWIQRRVPREMMGRAMSIFMFIFMGLAPLSAAATGWLLQSISLTQLFAGGGALLLLFALTAAIATPMRRIAYTNSTEPT
ncbi:MFS transporter [Rugamonas sp. CCM 8940]|uniref:MFS transporter n=1 Tax=Rugamonas sp. CCM 8940 TaxID=2765359 RepID=UPI0018F579E1|nr:MFS transporter [Rugamonas sp. CCM 8940]MBJ7313047.1 MFS transporter [Rugamonas sp. CCM 8940]